MRDELGLKGGGVEARLDEGGGILMERLPRKRRILRAGRKLLPEEVEEIIEEGLMGSLK